MESSMDEQKPHQIQRQTAHIVNIRDITTGEFVVQGGWEPNYVKSAWGEHLSRVQFLGTIIEVNSNISCTLDDGSGQIDVRSFDPSEIIAQLEVGALVRVVGKIREYQQQRYILPEIIIPLNNTQWLALHKATLEVLAPNRIRTEQPSLNTNNEEEKEVQLEENTSQDLLLFIDSLDKGDGVNVSMIIDKAKEELGIEDGREQINELLLQGEIFELKPDVVKVLK